jgi:hypothetical protein
LESGLSPMQGWLAALRPITDVQNVIARTQNRKIVQTMINAGMRPIADMQQSPIYQAAGAKSF